MKINLQNYEEWMVDYIEGNLTPEQQRELQEFLVFHPELQKELEAFGMTKLVPDTTVVFPDKASLKREAAGGRVLTLYSWVKYTAAAAAMFTLFIGIRYFGGAPEQSGIQQYAYEAPAISTPDRNTTATTTLAQATETPVSVKKTVKQMRRPDRQIAAIQDTPKEREINPIQKIENSNIDMFAYTADASLKSPFEENTDALAVTDQHKATVYANSTVISLNDNKTVVDWWNDAVAIGTEMNTVVTGVMEADLNPFKKRSDEEEVRVRNVNVPGFSYYSRKANN